MLSEDLRRIANALLYNHALLKTPKGPLLIGPRPEMIIIDRAGVETFLAERLAGTIQWGPTSEALIASGILAPTTLDEIWALDLLRATIVVEGREPPLNKALALSDQGLTALSSEAVISAYRILFEAEDDIDAYRTMLADLGRSSHPLHVKREVLPDQLILHRWASSYADSCWWIWQAAQQLGWPQSRVRDATRAMIGEGKAVRIESESNHASWHRFALCGDPLRADRSEARQVYLGGEHVRALVAWLLAGKTVSFTAQEVLRLAPQVGGLAGLRASTDFLERLGWIRYLPTVGRGPEEIMDRRWSVVRINKPDPSKAMPSDDKVIEQACLDAIRILGRVSHPTTNAIVKKTKSWNERDVELALNRLMVADKLRACRHEGMDCIEAHVYDQARCGITRHGRIPAVRWSMILQPARGAQAPEHQDSPL